jgi:hypothetical protein
MSLLLAAFAFAFVLLLLAVGWLANKPLPEEAALGNGKKIEELLPMHTHHFPQLRQSLNSADSRYLHKKLSKEGERMWHAERRQIVQSFLTGLAGDFTRLERFAQVVGSMSLHPAGRNIFKRAWLSLRFRLNYRFLSLWIRAGGSGSMRQIARLTLLVGNLAALAEVEMSQLEIARPTGETI